MKKAWLALILLVVLGLVAGCSSQSELGRLSNDQLRKENQELKLELEATKNKLMDNIQKEEDWQKRKEFLQQFQELYNQPLQKGENQPGAEQAYSKQLKTTLDGSYSAEQALGGVATVRTYLKSFAKLTEQSRNFLTEEQLNIIDNTDDETQTLGFTNVPLVIEGALRDQNFLIKKMDFAVALKSYELGQIQQAELVKKAEAFKRAKADYEKFLERANFAD